MRLRNALILDALCFVVTVPPLAFAAEPEAPRAQPNPLERAEGAAHQPSTGPAAPDPRSLVPAGIRDPSTGLVTATVLVPPGWKVNDHVRWWQGNWPVAINYPSVTSPDESITIRSIPTDAFVVWPEGMEAARRMALPPLDFGGEFIADLLDVRSYVLEVVVPRHRRLKDVKLVEYEQLPNAGPADEQAAALAALLGNRLRVETARVRIAYEQDGQAMEEDVFCALGYQSNPHMDEWMRGIGFAQSAPVNIMPQLLWSVSAPKGKLDGVRPLAQAVVGSVRKNVQWEAFQANLPLQGNAPLQGNIPLQLNLHAIQQQGAMDRARIRAEAQDYVNRIYSSVNANQQRAMERSNAAFSGYIRQHYGTGPDGWSYPIPDGKAYGYVDSSGHVIGTDDPWFEPPPGYRKLRQ